MIYFNLNKRKSRSILGGPRSTSSVNFLLVILVATITCCAYCNGQQQLVETAFDILREKGLDGNLRRPPLKDDSVNAIDVSGMQHPQGNNRSLIWKNYTQISGFVGELDEEFLEGISLVWLLASPPTPRAHHIMGVLYIFMMSIGFVGNAFVLFMFLKCRSLRTPANSFVMNLALSDWMMMCKIPIIIHNSFHNGPDLGSWGCQTFGFVGALSGTLSITTLTAIAVDRYNVIVYPLNPNRSTTFMKARLMILFCWIYSLIFSGIPLLKIGLSSYVPEGFLTCCSFDYLTDDVDARIFMFVYFVAAWCVPFFLIAYCYSHILHVVVSANSIQSSKDKNKQEVKLAAVVFGVIALWFVAWTPYAIVALLGISGNQHLLSPLGSMLPAFFAKGAACINPYVYAVTHPRFRMECGKMFFNKSDTRNNMNTSVGPKTIAETNVDGRRADSIDESIDETIVEQ